MERLSEAWCSYCGGYLPEGVDRESHIEATHPIEAERERQERRDATERLRLKRRLLSEQNDEGVSVRAHLNVK